MSKDAERFLTDYTKKLQAALLNRLPTVVVFAKALQRRSFQAMVYRFPPRPTQVRLLPSKSRQQACSV